MKKKKNNKGFTLVEVIVVAVIVAVLAAVAIPLYTGYIRDSRTNVCENTAASIASALTAANAQDNMGNVDVSDNQSFVVTSLSDANVETTIDLPAGYTFTNDANSVTVSGPGGSSATVNWQ